MVRSRMEYLFNTVQYKLYAALFFNTIFLVKLYFIISEYILQTLLHY